MTQLGTVDSSDEENDDDDDESIGSMEFPEYVSNCCVLLAYEKQPGFVRLHVCNRFFCFIVG